MSGWIFGGMIYAMIGIGVGIDTNNRGTSAAASAMATVLWPIAIGVILNAAVEHRDG